MYNNIKYHYSTHEPIEPSYMNDKIINLKIGRNLFVDNYLIESMSNCDIKYYKGELHKKNPILKLSPNEGNVMAAPNMDAVIYDPYSKHFKMFYTNFLNGESSKLSLAISDDGINWIKPIILNKKIKAFKPCCKNCETLEHKYNESNNIVSLLGGCKNGKGRGSSIQLLDRKEKDRTKIFKMLFGHCNFLNICESKDGINWSMSDKTSGWGSGAPWYTSYNPFKKKYIFTFRDNLPHANMTRVQRYKEVNELTDKWSKWNKQESYGGVGFRDITQSDPQIWACADKYDTTISNRPPAIYGSHTIPYENLMINFFSVYKGQHSVKNIFLEIYLGFSRNGTEYYRPTKNRQAFIEEDKNNSNNRKLQSYMCVTGGNLLIKDEEIFIYVCNTNQQTPIPTNDTLLYTLRRDGFASVSSLEQSESVLTTKILNINAEYLFVNFDCGNNGYLKVEILNEDNEIINEYSKDETNIFTLNSTKHNITWKNKKKVVIDKIKIKFYFVGSLYSFWFSDNINGKSNGFIGNGGPDYEYFSDTIDNNEKLNIHKFSNIEITIKRDNKVEKIIYSLEDYATKINNFERYQDNCGVIVKYNNINNKECVLNIDLKFEIAIINIKLIL